jgi:hypothetical protein
MVKNYKLQIFVTLLLISSQLKSQNVGINETGSNPDGSAMLDVTSTNKGILIPRLTRAQKFLINTPANGLLIYQTDDTMGFWYYETNKWVPLMRSMNFGKGLTGGFIQGKGTVDVSKPGVTAGTFGNNNEYPVLSINDYGQVTVAGTKKFIDNDTMNEIQKIRLSKDTVYLSKNGGFVHLNGFWGTSGNSGLNSSHFLGTLTAVPLKFRVNNTWFGELNHSNSNISLGYLSNSSSTGYSNIAIGREALSANQGGYYNTALGWQAMYDNNTGNYNTGLGAASLYANSTGSYNVGIGYEPLRSNTSGSYNVGIGFRSLYTNTSGTYNVGVGMYTLYYNVSGVMNAAVGYYALGANVYGHYNAGLGNYALTSNNLGLGNAFVGYAAGYYNNSGYYNQGVGYYAGFQNATGYYNSSLGYYNGPNQTDLDNTTALGSSTRTTASNQVRVGNSSVTSIGGFVAWTNLSDARFKRNIQKSVKGLDFIMKLEPVTYNLDVRSINSFIGMDSDTIKFKGKYDQESIRYSGFIAQDVEKAAQSIGYDFSGVDKPKNEKDYYGLRYSEFVVPLVKAVQEQQVLIQNQAAQIEQQQKQLQELIKQNQQIIQLNQQLLKQINQN